MRFLFIAVFLGACTGDATGPEGALEKALEHVRAPVATSDAGDATANSGTRTTIRFALTFTRGETSHSLAIDRHIDRLAAKFRTIDQRAWTAPAIADPKVPVTEKERVESLFDGAAFAWKRGDGQWIERDVLDGLPRRTLEAALDLGPAIATAFGDYLRSTPLRADDAHPSEVGGARVIWSAVTLDSAVRPRALTEGELAELKARDPTTLDWIAATHRPSRIEGELARSADGGIVASRIIVEGDAPFPDGRSPFRLELSQTVVALPESASFELPAERLPAARERPWLMIEDVLGEGLLPPYRR